MLLIALKGFAGSGKSTLGRALGERLGYPVVDKDDVKISSMGTLQRPGDLPTT